MSKKKILVYWKTTKAFQIFHFVKVFTDNHPQHNKETIFYHLTKKKKGPKVYETEELTLSRVDYIDEIIKPSSNKAIY